MPCDPCGWRFGRRKHFALPALLRVQGLLPHRVPNPYLFSNVNPLRHFSAQRLFSSLSRPTIAASALLARSAFGCSSARAQTTTPGAPAAGETAPIVLSPFSVTSASDVGYAAGDSLAASRF